MYTDYQRTKYGFAYTIMSTVKEIRDLLLYSYCDGIISDEGFLILYDAY